MKPLLGTLAFAVALLCPLVAAPAIGSSPGAPAPPSRAGDAITLVHQELALAADADLVVQFHPSTPVVDGGSITVVTYQPIANREALARAITGRLGSSTDRVDLAATQVTTDPATGNVVITVPTESEASAPEKLRLATAGLYPVAVEIRDADGVVVNRLVTFVDRLPPAGSDPLPAISVALLASITAPPRLPGANTPLPADVTAAIDELLRYPAGLPVSLDISPEILGRLDTVTAGKLGPIMSNGAILSQPITPFDPSAAVAGGLADNVVTVLSDLFKTRLRDGEDAIDALGFLPHPTRTVWYASDGVTDAGAQMLRDLGVRVLVIPSAVYLESVGNTGALTDYSQLFQAFVGLPDSAANTDDTAVQTDDGGQCADTVAACMPTAVIDPVLAGRLVDPALSDEQSALYTAADLVTYRDFFAESMSANSRHALVLGLDGTGVANATRVSRAVEMTTATGAANFITIDQLEVSSSQAIADGRPLELQLPQPTPVDLNPRAQTLAAMSLTIPAVASMLPEDDARPTLWNSTVSVLYSSSLTDDDVTAAVASLNDSMDEIKRCIVPPSPYTFTLSGRSTKLPLRFTNTCDGPLTITLRLDAAGDKMEFPDNEAPHVLLPGSNDVKLEVTARTNGTFDVRMRVWTPLGHLPVTDDIMLRARINTLTGLPQVITGVALLLLLTWWARNLRRSRRARRSLAAIPTHPAGGA